MTYVDYDTRRELAVAILQQAFEDWESLDRGRLKSRYYTGQTVRREELISFFRSETFEDLCLLVFNQPVSKIRRALGIQMGEVDNAKPR